MELFSLALSKLSRRTTLNVVRTVEQAQRYVTLPSRSAAEPHPDLILMDARLAGQSGLDFLRWCKDAPQLCKAHLIVFTGSVGAQQIAEAFKLGADAVEMKPLTFPELLSTVTRILRDWCE